MLMSLSVNLIQNEWLWRGAHGMRLEEEVRAFAPGVFLGVPSAKRGTLVSQRIPGLVLISSVWTGNV